MLLAALLSSAVDNTTVELQTVEVALGVVLITGIHWYLLALPGELGLHRLLGRLCSAVAVLR